jgi:predicted nucleic acid-binding protein
MPWVFDASIVMAWCFDDERTDATEALLERLDRDLGTVPQLWHLEVANVLSNAMRKRPKARITESGRTQFLEMLAGAPIRVDTQTQQHAWATTLSLADKHKLSVYDAAYLELAMRLGVPLATLDADLRAAAKICGVPLLP